MNDKHFYLTLPSNSSKAYFGHQHPSRYKTKLEHAVSLDPELWEVGLAEISYPKSWHNLPVCSFYLSYPSMDVPSGDRGGGHSIFITRKFGGTRYMSPRHLIRDLQIDVKSSMPVAHAQAIKIRYDEVAHKAKFTLKKDFGLWVQGPLGKTLGLSGKVAAKYSTTEGVKGYLLPNITGDYDPEASETVIVTPYTVDVDRLTPTIYVYCSLIQQQHVGDAYVQLLRTITVPDTGGELVTLKYTNVHYTNLQTGSFEAVEISLSDSLGAPLGFKHGDVIVKLHFRRKTP